MSSDIRPNSDEAAAASAAGGDLDSKREQPETNSPADNTVGEGGSPGSESAPERTAEQEHHLHNSIISSEAPSSGTDTIDTPLGDDNHLQNSTLFRESVQRLGNSLVRDYVDMDEHDSHRPGEGPAAKLVHEEVDERAGNSIESCAIADDEAGDALNYECAYSAVNGNEGAPLRNSLSDSADINETPSMELGANSSDKKCTDDTIENKEVSILVASMPSLNDPHSDAKQSASTSYENEQIGERSMTSREQISTQPESMSDAEEERCNLDSIPLDATTSREEAQSGPREKEGNDASEADTRKGGDGGPQHDVATDPDAKPDGRKVNAASTAEMESSSLSPMASKSLQSDAPEPERKSPTKSERTKSIPLKASPPDRSLLTRGMSLFAKSSNQMRYYAKGDNDASSVVSEMTQGTKSAKPTSLMDKSNDDALRQHLEESGLVLLRRLIEFLSECPPAPGEAGSLTRRSRLKSGSSPSKQKKKQRGLTLPASALGWLSSQLTGSCNDAFEGIADCYQVPEQQLQCVQSLFKRVTSIRISGEVWPPPHASAAKAKATVPDKASISTKLLSKFGGDQTVEEECLDDESCSTAPSRVDTTNDPEISVSPFQRFYHELQHNPDVNMSFFPNATKVVIDGIPPNWVAGLDSLRSLDMFQMEKGCILDINQLFFPSDISAMRTTIPTQQKSLGLHRDLSLIEELKEERESQAQSGDESERKDPSPVVYPALTKLRLSNCAMGEGAGLRGRPTPKSVPRLPTLSRFPNLVCLNLSRNELFKTKTVFAGLASLPLLSWIDLSYNRLSSMDDIFMHVGNVTELILTGNEISSTRGLDRLFSLERLSIDENKIYNLANIAGIAKLPFLMNFDLKGNPLETDDPASCRIKVFNLFRDVRCSNLPKNATFRDMQRLLPVLDNELATKDELVALKGLTFRQTVIPAESLLPSETNDMNAEANRIDESSEISVNIPTSGRIRHIVKSSVVNTSHFRMAGSGSLEKKAAGRLERFHNSVDSRTISFLVDSRIRRKDETRRHHGVKFGLDDLITSIRPDIRTGDASFLGERGRTSSSGFAMAMAASLSSHRSEGGGGDSIFPFGLPLDLLAEADDDVWDSPTQLDLIPPSDTIVWDDVSSRSNDNDQYDDDGLSDEIDVRDARSAEAQPPTKHDELLPRPCQEHGQDDDDFDPDPTAESNSDLKPRKSMFDDIWEQSYRDNVSGENESPVKDTLGSNEKPLEIVDFNVVEQESEYDGPADYGSLFVSSDLDLYFDSFVFHGDSSEDGSKEDSSREMIAAPRIQLFKFDRDQLFVRKRQERGMISSTIDYRERYIGVWKENVLACGSYARSRLPPLKLAKRGFHGDSIMHAGKDAMISESRKFIICLSDSALYFIVDDEVGAPEPTDGKRIFPSRVPPNSTFSDACWPHAVIRHPLDCLRGITIGFQFQRLILRFRVGNATTSSSFEYTYVILTSNKLRTVSLLQKLQSHVTDNQIGMGALIDNDDKAFLDALGAPNEVVLHYQILHQIWKRGDREASRRAFVLTDSRAYLLDEFYTGDGTNNGDGADKSKRLGNIFLSVIDSARLSRVTEVRAANEDPRKITLVILPQNKLKRSHRWRLVCNDGEGAERLIEDVRRARGES